MEASLQNDPQVGYQVRKILCWTGACAALLRKLAAADATKHRVGRPPGYAKRGFWIIHPPEET
jgi:hypothetical protein